MHKNDLKYVQTTPRRQKQGEEWNKEIHPDVKPEDTDRMSEKSQMLKIENSINQIKKQYDIG